MYVERIPNRNSSPAVLLHESWRQDGKVKKRTLANLSKLPPHVIDAIALVLKGGSVIKDSLSNAFDITRSLPHGHVVAVLAEGALALWDITSTWYEGHSCSLAARSYSRDGWPVAIEAYAGNTADPSTVASQVTTLRRRFGLDRVVLVGDRGMLSDARIREDLLPAGFE